MKRGGYPTATSPTIENPRIVEASPNQSPDIVDCKCKVKGECKKQQKELVDIVEENLVLENDIEIKNFDGIRVSYKNIIDTNSIEKMIERLEAIEIIGSNILKYWHKDKIQHKLEIINPEHIIISKEFTCRDQHKLEEFKMHVNDLLRLGVIRSTKDSPLGLSPHRSPAAIIVKHSERVRGKSRMVFDYRRLNDNTYRDGYNIPILQDLIHLTKGAKVFSKFDCK